MVIIYNVIPDRLLTVEVLIQSRDILELKLNHTRHIRTQ